MSFVRFLAARLAQSALSLLVVLGLVFVLLEALGSPVESRLPLTATEADRQVLIERYGLDDPLPVQYMRYVGKAVRGDFGESITYGQPVGRIISGRLPNTLALSAMATALSAAVAVPAGVVAARRRGRLPDVALRLGAITGQSLPPFWVGLGLIYLFALTFKLVPTGGRAGPASYVLPTLTMSLFIAPALMRITRSAMITVLESDHVRFARALNVPERIVLTRYALRAAAVPIVTYAGILALATITGAVVTETVFSWPGIGSLAVQAVTRRDFPMVETIVALSTMLYLAANLVLDVSYGLLDPRIRVGGGR